ncbi:MAG: SDR family NAD(P)-dependent oxidoreductase [Sulfuritalea sp.]|nr:SDR family NAD(P)-dependent oxidoreductase [Sulfuritalea sp.]
MQEKLRIVVVGATGGSGRATVERLLAQGHSVTAFSRSADRLIGLSEQLTTIKGDVMNTDEVDRAVAGQDVIVVTLGISENVLRVRFVGAAHTPDNVRSAGTRNVIAAMKKHAVRRLVVQTSYGVGETRSLLGFVERLFFSLVLKPQMEDTEVQEQEVRKSGVEWVIAQPVHLTDEHTGHAPYVSVVGQTRFRKVARTAVASFLAQAAIVPDYLGRSVAISG